MVQAGHAHGHAHWLRTTFAREPCPCPGHVRGGSCRGPRTRTPKRVHSQRREPASGTCHACGPDADFSHPQDHVGPSGVVTWPYQNHYPRFEVAKQIRKAPFVGLRAPNRTILGSGLEFEALDSESPLWEHRWPQTSVISEYQACPHPHSLSDCDLGQCVPSPGPRLLAGWSRRVRSPAAPRSPAPLLGKQGLSTSLPGLPFTGSL